MWSGETTPPRAGPGPRPGPAVALLLLHVSLVLAAYAGAGLATGARLKWDPSTYIAARELLPAEYRVAAAYLPLAGAALLALGHLALLALSARRSLRRLLLLLHAAGMAALVASEVAWAWWTAARVAAWLRTDEALQLVEVLEVREHLRPLLHFLGRWHPLPTKIKEILDEAEADLPRNGYVAGAAGALLLPLQLCALVLALLAARRAAPRAHKTPRAGEHAPLRAANGAPRRRSPLLAAHAAHAAAAK